MSLVLAVLPLLLIIATGYVLARSGALPAADWKGIETLSFRVLIPAVLILAIIRTDLSWATFGTFMITLMLTWALVSLLALMLRLFPHARLENPAFTTLFQTGLRWNAFVALAAAEQFTGDAGLSVLAVAIALLIPTINISCIVVLSAFGPGQVSLGGVSMMVLKNPLVQACLVGLGLYFSDLALPDPILQALDMIGRGALAVGLLAVGAGISLRRLARWDWQVGVALLLRPILGPAIFAGFAFFFGLSPLQAFTGVLVFAAPAATNGYIVAKQMGGNAELYADVLTWQTLLSLAVMPLWAWVFLSPA
ncbi:AEC family transporter [Sulfitobacter aestuariivivens]|uniref:AEC family transporter n=1 Tax=Sulfitobacter aestuariivivens TaxID=2766981 RepID=A0A927D713_9RHOB|nr:AEC family transporter [Sulfitobacter aestuariivivens]MBD3665571.1 AEC family transporter [Sulfitobacter aestuariivivens]